MLREARLKEYLNQQREIKHQEAVIEKLRSSTGRSLSSSAESREKMLERIQPVEKLWSFIRIFFKGLEPSCRQW